MLNIAILTDFSDNSLHAIKYAEELFKNERCNIYILNSYYSPSAGAGMMVSIDAILKEEAEKDMDAFEKKIKQLKLFTDDNVKYMVEHGSVVDVVMNLKKRHKLDLIIMGTKGASGLKEVLIGSNTADVIKSGVCTTLSVPEHTEVKNIERILLASDNKGFKKSETFGPLNFVAQKCGAEVLVMNVKTSPVDTDPTAEIKSNFNDLLKGTNHSFQTRENQSIEEGLNDFVNLENIDLLAMVSRKIGFIQTLFHKSMTKNMAMHSTVPLLVMYE